MPPTAFAPKIRIYTGVVVWSDTLRGPSVKNSVTPESVREWVQEHRARPEVLSATMHVTAVPA